MSRGAGKNSDERVVSLKFDNADFEKRAKQSLNTLESIDKKLDLKKQNASLSSLGKAVKSMDFSGLASNVEALRKRFSFLGEEINRLETKFVSSITNMGKQFLIDPIKDGFGEYETQINSITTMLTNYDTTAKQVGESTAASAKESSRAITESLEEISLAVIRGDYGNGKARFDALEAAGYDADKIQNAVNHVLASDKTVSEAIKELEGSAAEAGDGITKTVTKSTETTEEKLAHIEGVLNELNDYADKTVYSFGDMTSAIGQFMTAGVDMDTSAEAIQGLSNLAAAFGVDNARLKNTFYQLSQAISAGSVKLMDWRSVINANMSGPLFRDEIIRTAEEMGAFTAVGIDATAAMEDFNGSLSKGWLTADVLTASIAKFTDSGLAEYFAEKTDLTVEDTRALIENALATDDTSEAVKVLAKHSKDLSKADIKRYLDQLNSVTKAATQVRTFTQLIDVIKEAIGSGWAQTWKLIIGNYSEAVDLFTGINNAITPLIDGFSDARNAMLSMWKEAGGRTALINSIGNLFKAFLSVVAPVKKALSSLFPSNFGKVLADISIAFEKFTKKLIISDDVSERITKTLGWLFSIIRSIAGTAFSAARGAVKTLVAVFKPFAGAVFYAVEGLVQFAEKLRLIVKQSGIVRRFSDALTRLFDRVGHLFSSIYTYIANSGAVEFFRDMFDSIISFVSGRLDELSNMKPAGWLVDFSNRIAEAFNKIKSAAASFKFPSFKEFLERVSNFRISKDFSSLGEIASKIVDLIQDLFTTTDENLDGVNERLDGVRDRLSGLAGPIKGTFRDIQNGLIGFVTSLISAANEQGLDGIMNLLDMASRIYLMWKGGSFFKAVTKGADGLTDVLNSLSGAITSIGKAALKEANAKAILSYAAALGILAVALIALSRVPLDDIWPAIGILAGLGVALVAFSYALSKIQTAFERISVQLGGKFAIMLAGFALVIIAIGAAAFGIAIALATLVGAIIALKKIIELYADPSFGEVFERGFSKIKEVISQFADFISNIRLGGVGSALALIAAVASVWLIYRLIAKFNEIDEDVFSDGVKRIETILDMLKKFVKGLLGFNTAMIAVSAIAQRGRGGSGTLGMAFLLGSIGVVLHVITSVIKRIGNMSLSVYEQGKRGLIAITVCVGLLAAALLAMSKFVGGVNATALAVSFIAVSVLIRTMVGVIQTLGNMDWGSWFKGLVSLGAMMGLLALTMNSMSKVDPKALAALSGMAALLAAIAFSVMIFGNMPTRRLAKGIAGIGFVMAELIVTFKAIGTSSLSLNTNTKGLIAIVLMAGMLVVVANVIKELADLPWYGMLSASISIGLVLGAIVFSLTTLNGIKTNWVGMLSAGGAIFVILGGLTLLSLGLSKLASQPFTSILAATAGLAAILVALSASVFILGIMGAGAAIEGAIAATGALLIFLTGTTGFFAVLGALSMGLKKISGISLIDLLEEAVDAMLLVGKAIGSLIGGIGAGVMAGAPAIGQYLSDFATNAGDFFAALKSFTPEQAKAAKNLVETILIFAKARIADAFANIASFFGGDSIGNYGEQLKAFGESVSGFVDSLINSGVNYSDKKVDDALKVLKKVLAIDIPRTGGLFQLIIGEKSFGNFGTQLKSLGEGVKEFANASADAKYDNVDAATKTIKKISAIDIGETGGIWGFIFGDKDLSSFGDNMKELGAGVASFCTATAGKDYSNVDQAVAAANQITGIAPTNTGWERFWGTTEDKFAGFETNASALGWGMANFAEATQGKDFSNVYSASVAVARLAASFSGETSFDPKKMQKFTESLTTLTSALQTFSASFASSATMNTGFIDIAALDTAIVNITKLAEMSERIDASNFTAFADALGQLGRNGISQFIKAFDGSDGSVDSAIAAVNGFLNAVNETMAERQDALTTNAQGLGHTLGTSFQKSLESTSLGAKQAAANLAIVAANALTEKAKSFTTAGSTCASNYASGLRNGKNVRSAGASIGTAALNGIREAASYLSFYNVGLNVVRGFVGGIRTATYEPGNYSVWNAGWGLGRRAYDAAKAAIESSSPSRKFMELGEYAGMGYVIGLSGYHDAAAEESAKIGESSLTSLRDSLKKVSMLASNEIEASPTIRPVVDLSGVKNSAAQISGMLGGDATIMARDINKDAANGYLGLISEIATSDSKNSPLSIDGLTVNVYGTENQSVKELADAVVDVIITESQRKAAMHG